MPSRLNAPSTEERSSRASSGLGGRSSPAMKELPAEPKDQQLMVALRIRPINDTELDEGATIIAHKVGDQVAMGGPMEIMRTAFKMVVLMDPDEDPDDALRANRSREKTFIFDIVFDQQASQEEVYCSTTQHLVEGVISGYNATVFAYGPSGAGKTYTMLGMDSEPGIYLQTLNDLFQAIEETSDDMEYTVSMSYLEIYNEVIRDLLNPSSEFLELREDSKGSIQIAGITEVSTTNAQEIMQLLIKGNKQRTQEPTAANKTSSRSHAVLQVTVKQRSRVKDLSEEVRVGKLFMVDLAGSERASQTQNRGKRMKEGAHINRSLLALGNCINALSEKGGSRSQYVNFRDSKLTRLLKDALGGNSRTVMIAHISPASTYFEESRTTLIYAYRAKNIKTRVKRNLLNVSYHIAQYTDVISDLRREIEHLKSKIEKQEKEKKNGPDIRDVQAEVHHDSEEDSRIQMNKIRGQLISAFKEQMEMRRSLMELENTNIELHIDTSRHLLTIADWEREKAHQAHKEKDDENVEADGEGEEGDSNEPHEVSVAREEINMLLAEQRKTAALKAGLEQRLANTKKKASQMEKLLPKQIINKDQREVLRLLCKAHELEVENTELQANNLYQKNLLCQKDFVIQRYHQHRLLCEEIIQQQRELIKGNWIPVAEPLEKRYRLYSQELEEGTLNRLLLLHSVMFNSLRDGSVLNIAQQMELHKEDTSRDQLDNRKDLPWGAKFELPPIVIEPDSEGYKSSKATPSKKPGKRDSLLTPTSFRLLITPPVHEKSSSLSMKKMVSKLCSPTSLDLNMKKLGEDVPTSLSAEALKEIAVSTKSISLIAASRRSKTHDQEGGSSLSVMQSLDEGASEPKYWKPNLTPDLTESQQKAQADRKQLQSSPRRGRQRNSSLERRARRKRSPSGIRNAQMGNEKFSIPMIDHLSENQSSQSHSMQHSKAIKTLFPAVPVATKTKFPTNHHTDENTLQVPEISFTFPSAIWQCNPGQNRGPVLPREVKGSAESSSSHHNSLHPGITRKQLGGSAKKQGRAK